MNWLELGRFLIIAGLSISAVGLVLMLADKLPFGKLPGDFSFGGKNFKIHLPIATCIIVSILLTLIVNFFQRR